jgi:carbon-monoxide dehydrogenase small subunit
MKTLIDCMVNGEERSVLADTRDTLLDLLRDRLGLTGTKEGCGNGNCGTCTVLIDGAPVNACLVLALEAPGRDITTIEGLSRGDELHPLQLALVEHGGTQCGFCTPGIVLAAKALLDENPRPTDAQIRHAIAGNLCRCTGYGKIVAAIAAVAAAQERVLAALRGSDHRANSPSE